MKKSLILLATTALLANVAASSVVFAAEGAEAPEAAVVIPEVAETEALVPEGAKAEAATAVAETETVEAAEAEVSVGIETADEAQIETVEAPSSEDELKPEGAVSESPTEKYSEELLLEFGTKTDLIHTSIYHGNYTTESSQKALSLRKDATNLVYPHWEAGTLTDEIIREGLRLADLALASLVPKQPEAPKPGEQPAPEAPKPGEQPAPEAPKPETPAPEAPKSTLPDTGDAESTAKLKSMTMEKPVSTMPATQSDNKQLPQTGEADSFAIFSAAALTILAGVGMLAYGKREEV
ncbi:LPXTG cell wall anchor domain-containing protein [Aerococcaceae bacterium NML201209]|nr:LPXTG cell wall anchor domain-containing protein [Aerococcaceae bacterium NML201209]